MSVRIIAEFQDKSRAASVRRELRKLGVTANVITNQRGPEFHVDALKRDYNYQALRQGLLGAATGCVLGTLAVPLVPMKQLMFTLIVPLSATYVGLAWGLFVAGLYVQARAMLQKSKSNPVKEGCIAFNQSRETTVEILLGDEAQLASVHRFLDGQHALTAQVIVTADQDVLTPTIEQPISLLLSA